MAFDQQNRNKNERDKFEENSEGDVTVRVKVYV